MNNLASGECGLTDGSVAGDWHMPNVKELQSLIYFGFHTPPLTNAEGTGQWTEGDAFIGVRLGPYQSSTVRSELPTEAFIVHFQSAHTFSASIEPPIGVGRLWPIRR